ncbi:CinA family protein [Georgenia subflava]|uniref:Nicotinamide-nucleotide amidohydrolase family protein n=1 Tax=Georgenia subflava TaxID=1622177 RepID=A0A6N7EIT3_9MICO|nr:CinA family protein [Georgenia subflava]MPV37990.1 nicotinamide-nucleotide amidohydrolase family protein [Georgenia subflava]
MTDGILDAAHPLLDEIAARLDGSGRTIAVAESLTAGKIASHLGAAPSSSTWFAGGVVAYTNEVKYSVLGVERGPVVTARCAEQMATGVARLTGADIAVAVTGVGGPGPEEGKEAGTVYIGACAGARSTTEHHQLDGGPEEILAKTTLRALTLLLEMIPTGPDHVGRARP